HCLAGTGFLSVRTQYFLPTDSKPNVPTRSHSHNHRLPARPLRQGVVDRPGRLTGTPPMFDIAAEPLRLSSSERSLLLMLERRALRYFIDNQCSHGLILDRQSNFGRRRSTGLVSTSATGMGLMSL